MILYLKQCHSTVLLCLDCNLSNEPHFRKTISIETPTINSAIAFATKGKEWSYENEVRLIDYNPNIEAPYYGIALDTESSIESIYFGFRCEESTINTIKALFKNHNVTPKFYKMELDRSNVYKMICKEL